MKNGNLYVVATPIGNLDDITFRAIETLKKVDIILAEDTRKTLKLLNHYEISKKLISFYRHNEILKTEEIIHMLEEGKNIALVSDAGTPAISDPGEELIKEAIKKNIEIIPIPGAIAFVQGLVGSGFDTSRFVFEGFLSIKKKLRRETLTELKNEKRTMIFYEAPHKLLKTLDDFKETFGSDRKVVLARELTKIYEEFLRMSLDEAITYYTDKKVKGEFVILIEGKIGEKKLSIETVEELMDKYLNMGYERKEAMKLVAKDKGISKSEVYKILLEKM